MYIHLLKRCRQRYPWAEIFRQRSNTGKRVYEMPRTTPSACGYSTFKPLTNGHNAAGCLMNLNGNARRLNYSSRGGRSNEIHV